MTAIPATALDLFTDDVLLDPYPAYRVLRDLGPIVRLEALDMYAFPRYDQVRSALADWQTFSSAKGVMLNDEVNTALEGITLCSDPPLHTQLRTVLMRPLRSDQMLALRPRLEAEAAVVMDRLVAQGEFNAVELATHLPMTVVSELVGLGTRGRERMLDWAAATFDAIGPANQRMADAMPKLADMLGFAATEATPEILAPDGWAARLYQAVKDGELAADAVPGLIIDYIAPSLDTTIHAISSMIHLLAANPDQWTLLRHDRTLVPHAVNEVLRLESPIQRFSRLSTTDVTIEGHSLPADSRVVLLYGSANRDERKYAEPDRFDIARRPSDHLAFGRGEHACAGMNLARLEMTAVLDALLDRVTGLDSVELEWEVNNTLRGLRKLVVRVQTS
ncbi:cytochrome P450 [Kribbella albertanoniae]|uniref:Cytochrome P450 n=1 Tax=Kribbella albertanoniae TaxID=1266829 RepID=A0A4R4Q2Q3_9ACTN|nr:cytochrome P450 [Kribbella albertanoniae]TDC29277.1 cytochrome P450 [Kribbella albertanoniae]